MPCKKRKKKQLDKNVSEIRNYYSFMSLQRLQQMTVLLTFMFDRYLMTEQRRYV